MKYVFIARGTTAQRHLLYLTKPVFAYFKQTLQCMTLYNKTMQNRLGPQKLSNIGMFSVSFTGNHFFITMKYRTCSIMRAVHAIMLKSASTLSVFHISASQHVSIISTSHKNFFFDLTFVCLNWKPFTHQIHNKKDT